MNKRFAVLAGILLIALIGGSLYYYSWSSSTEEGSIVWRVDIPHFATSIEAADGKVFVDNDFAQVQCFDANNGASIWNASLSYANYGGGPQVKVYGDKVYASQESGIVEALNIKTGDAEASYKAPPVGMNDYKRLPTFFLADNKLFASSGGTAAFDLSSGSKLWENGYRGLVAGNQSASQQQSNYIYMVGTKRINPNNGALIWSYPNTTNTAWGYYSSSNGNAIVCNDKVVIWNYASNYSYPLESDYSIICLNAQNGEQLWHFNSTAFSKPIATGDLLLFPSKDGYFYALNLADGAIKWKTNVDDSGLLYNYSHSDVSSRVFSSFYSYQPLLDEKNGRIYWTFSQGNSKLLFMSLNINSGQTHWHISITNASIRPTSGQSMVQLNDKIFLTGYDGVFCIQASTGNMLWQRQFDHHVTNPILGDGKVYIGADLWVFAYR